MTRKPADPAAREPSAEAKIVTDLFTNGLGHEAERLVLFANGKDIGGWGRGPVRDKIQSALRTARLSAYERAARAIREKIPAGAPYDVFDAGKVKGLGDALALVEALAAEERGDV